MATDPNSNQQQFLPCFTLPLQVFSALRTIKIYPASNPQVQKVVNAVYFTLSNYFQKDPASSQLTLGISDQKILVNDQMLDEKEQKRPQIKGFTKLFNELELHSITFHRDINYSECKQFLILLAGLNTGRDKKKVNLKNELLENGLTTVTVDEKRYVAVREGEQVVSGYGGGGTGVRISEDELTGYVLGHGGIGGEAIPATVQELIDSLSTASAASGQSVVDLSARLLGLLEQVPEEAKEEAEISIQQSAASIAALDSQKLVKLLSNLPNTTPADKLLGATVGRLSIDQLSSIITKLAQFLPQPGGVQSGQSESTGVASRILSRLDSGKLAALMRNLPESEPTDKILDSTVEQLSDQQLQSFFTGLAKQRDITGPAKETSQREAGIAARIFAGLDNKKLLQLVDSLPESENAFLGEAAEKLSVEQLNALVHRMSAQAATGGLQGDGEGQASPEAAARILSGIGIEKLAALMERLPATPTGDALVETTMLQLPPEKIGALLTKLGQQDVGSLQGGGTRASSKTAARIFAGLDSEKLLGLLENVNTMPEAQESIGAAVDSLDDEEVMDLLDRLLHPVTDGASVDEKAGVQNENTAAAARILTGLGTEKLFRVLQRLPETIPGDEVVGTTVEQLDAKRLSGLLQLMGQAGPSGEGGVALETESGIASRILSGLDRNTLVKLLQTAPKDISTPDYIGSTLGNLSLEQINSLLHRLLRYVPAPGKREEGRQENLVVAAQILSGLDSEKLKTLLKELPESGTSSVKLAAAAEQLSVEQLRALVTKLADLAPPSGGGDAAPADSPGGIASFLLERLKQVAEGTPLESTLKQQDDFRLLQMGGVDTGSIPMEVIERLKAVDWSTPMLIDGIKQVVAGGLQGNGAVKQKAFSSMLDAYGNVLSEQEQNQVIAKAAPVISSLEEEQLGVALVKRYKGIFGEKLYEQVLSQLSDDKLERITFIIRDLAKKQDIGKFDLDDAALQETYQQLVRTVRTEKIRAVVNIHQEKEQEKKEKRESLLEQGIEQIHQGDLSLLKNREVLAELPDKIINLLLDEQDEEADGLLGQIALGLHHEDNEQAESAAACLAMTSRRLARAGQFHRLSRFLPALEELVGRDDLDKEVRKHCEDALTRLSRHHIIQGDYRKARQILRSMHRAEPGSRKKALSVENRVASLPILEQLTADYIEDSGRQVEAAELLSALGSTSAEFLIKKLSTSESRSERKKILALVGTMGNSAIPILTEQLEKDNPWYVYRNTIRLLGELRSSGNIEKIEPFLSHADIRVQKEALNTIALLGGPQKKTILQGALNKVDETLLGQNALALGDLQDENVVGVLQDLFNKAGRLNVKYRENIQEKICMALGRSGSRSAVPILEKIRGSSGKFGLGGPSERVRKAAESAMRRIRITQEKKEASRKVQVRAHNVAKTIIAQEKISRREQEIQKLAEDGKTEEAKQQLVELAAECAEQGDYGNAERLRGRLYDIDSMEITEIIRSGSEEIQKGESEFEDEEIERWRELTEELTTQEFNTLYHDLEQIEYGPGEVIVTQGDKNDQLFFIKQGSIKVSYQHGDREFFVKTLISGEVVGENFFNASLWTVSLTSLTAVKLLVLHRKKVTGWRKKHAGLERKLYQYYEARDDVFNILEKKNLERRQYERFASSRKIQAHLTDKSGKRLGNPFVGALIDISRGGTSFIIHIAKRENGRMLLGWEIEIILPVGGKERELVLQGVVLAIQLYDIKKKDYSIHVKFAEEMSDETLQLVLG